MARSKMVKTEHGDLPDSILRQTYGENTILEGSPTSADSQPQNFPHTAADSCRPTGYNDEHDESSTSSGTSTDDFELISSVKEDLKQNIHKRRRQRGLGDIDLNSDFPRNYQLTDTEERKRRDRKERNRIAAAKCREKKKNLTYDLMQNSDQLEQRNRDLKEQADKLRLEKEYLKHLLREHLAVCPKKGISGCRR